MQFTTGSLSRCSGGNHFRLPITIGGLTRVLEFGKEDMETDFSSVEEARNAVLDRLRSAVKEAGATTFAQVQAAINNKSFQV